MRQEIAKAYKLNKEERRKINKIAHKRAQCLVPSYMYREEYVRQRTRLYLQFSIMLAANISFQQIEELTKSDSYKFQEDLIKCKNNLLSLR